MTHFDFKTLLPALLQVEDRVSMAHGLESRVPLLDHALVELAATIPADVKFKDGHDEARLQAGAHAPLVPDVDRRAQGQDGLPGAAARVAATGPGARLRPRRASRRTRRASRALVDNRKVLAGLESETAFGRKIWGLLCLELWQQRFHDREHEFKRLLTTRRRHYA